jgi:hypothetical protein
MLTAKINAGSASAVTQIRKDDERYKRSTAA